jgi:hypothetical protein
MTTETTAEVERNENGYRLFITDPVINPKNIHIINYDEYDADDNKVGEYWGIRREGQKGCLITIPTKDEAINEAKKIKMNDDVIVVHYENGQLERYIQ